MHNGIPLAVALAILCAVGPANAQPFPAGPGREILEKQCSVCHEPGMVLTQRRSAAEWRELVLFMKDQGAEVTDQQMTVLVDYLAKNWPSQSTAQPAATSAPAAASPPAAPVQTAPQPSPRQQPGAPITLYAPEQHDLYDGHFVVSANRVYMVGGVNDPPGWNHMDNSGASAKLVSGSVNLDVNEIQNTGTFEARLKLPEGELVLAIDKWNQFNPCQNGGLVAYLHEHGSDSGCGDNSWPKTFVFLAGWGFGHATLNGKPLYNDYEMHFMVTQGIRDRKTLRVNYPMPNKKSPAGEVNPATQQMDFYIRSPQTNEKNTPAREVFMHFFAMEVTWK
jgi:hypothetical protein